MLRACRVDKLRCAGTSRVVLHVGTLLVESNAPCTLVRLAVAPLEGVEGEGGEQVLTVGQRHRIFSELVE